MSDLVFPMEHRQPQTDGTYTNFMAGGLTKRELFAAMAMQGLLSAVYSSKEILNEFTTNEIGKYPAHVTGTRAITENALSYADALLKALESSDEK